jgi:mitofusin
MGGGENPLGLLKLYLHESRPLSQILLNNGVVDIFFTTPVQNRDGLKMMALFSPQEDIDIVVFVVSTENDLAESAKSSGMRATTKCTRSVAISYA